MDIYGTAPRHGLTELLTAMRIDGKPRMTWQLAALCAASLALMLPASAKSEDFCENSPFMPFNNIIQNVKIFEGKRVQTYVILMTDAKEYTLIRQSEFDIGVQVQSDDVSDAYAHRHNLHWNSRSDLLTDFLNKLRATRGEKAPLDMSQMGNYRQELLVCGRIYPNDSGYRFEMDDAILKKSYLLPSRRKK